MKNYILHIDTTGHNKTEVTIKGLDKEYCLVSHNKAQVVLSLIHKLLTDNKIKLTHIKSIEVNTNPGSFVGTRIGITVANTLGFLLNIPVNGKKLASLIEY